MTNSCCTHKIACRSKLAWSEMVIFGFRIFAFQLEFLQWALNIRNIKTFGWMTFETYLGWWNEFRRSDCFKIFAVSLIWRRPKCLIRLICVTVCFTWSGSKLVLFPLALIQCWWFKMHKFLSRKVFIWLTKLHLSSGILQLALKWWFVQYLARRWILVSNKAKTWLTQI